MSAAPVPRRGHAPPIQVSTRRYRFALLPAGDAPAPMGTPLQRFRDAATVARALIGSDLSECLVVLLLDSRHRLVGFSEVARGSLNVARLAPRDVLVPALLANAGAVVIAHNHPSGDASPSSADRRLTLALRQAFELVGLQLLDHVIVTAGSDAYSFADAECW